MLRPLMMVLVAILALGTVSISALMPAARAQSSGGQSAALKVVTSITPVADLIRNVGGDKVEVTALVPPGGEPEDYDPTPADAAAVARARVFFANGLGLEEYVGRLTESVGNPQLEVVTLSDGLPTLTSFGQGADEGGNPHLWLDPRNAIAYVAVVQKTLERIDASNAAVYRANATRYSGQLADLDAYIGQQVQAIPPAQRVLVTTHDAYPYFAARYGLTYLAVVRANPESDPSAQEYAQLVQVVRDRQVKAVFGEAGFSDRFISQLASDTGAQFVADLYTDTLSEQSPTDTYLGAMRYNADAIVSALR